MIPQIFFSPQVSFIYFISDHFHKFGMVVKSQVISWQRRNLATCAVRQNRRREFNRKVLGISLPDAGANSLSTKKAAVREELSQKRIWNKVAGISKTKVWSERKLSWLKPKTQKPSNLYDCWVSHRDTLLPLIPDSLFSVISLVSFVLI